MRLQERLVQETYAHEDALSAFLEDAAVNLLQACILTTADGNRQLLIDTAVSCAPARSFQASLSRTVDPSFTLRVDRLTDAPRIMHMRITFFCSRAVAGNEAQTRPSVSARHT